MTFSPSDVTVVIYSTKSLARPLLNDAETGRPLLVPVAFDSKLPGELLFDGIVFFEAR